MVNLPFKREKCDKCSTKLPKSHPKLYCSLCNKQKHLSCQKLTKSDASYINSLNIQWTCVDCISEILPLNACSVPRRDKTPAIDKFKLQCSACKGFSYSPRNVRTCEFCDQQVHAKCWKHTLGCIKCCEDIIPGFHTHSYELLGDPYLKNNKMYNPYRTTHFTQQIGELLQNEEESNQAFSDASELLVKCKYKQPSVIVTPSKTELSTLSLNVRTLGNKIENMRGNINFYNKFDVLLLNETNCIKEKLANGISDIILPGFHDPIIQNPIRQSGKGGGLALYVNKRVCDDGDDIVPFCPYSETENNSGEFQFVKLLECKGHRKTVILGNVYRTPSKSPEKFNNYFNIILQKLNTNRYANKIKYIVGDFNQDLIKYDDNLDCQNLIDNAHNHGFVQLVSRPTRITDHSATLIDHVYTNNLDSALSCNIITLDLSDHLATHTKISLGTSTHASRIATANSAKNDTETRMFNEANHETFKNSINAETWHEISADMNAQTAYNKFEEIYLKHYNDAYPLKCNKVRRNNERANPKPWILPWLENACARKQNAYHLFVKTPTPENKAKYEKLNSFCEKHVDLAKTKYRKAYFDRYQQDSRKQWQMINSLLGRKKKNIDIHKLTNCDGTIANGPASIADSFNKYFSSIASNLKQSSGKNPTQNNSTDGFRQFLNGTVSRSIYLDKVGAGEIHKIIKSFKNKSTRDTKIEALKIANSSHVFTSVLAVVINKSFEQGLFPEQMKVAKVVPIHKEGSRTEVGNYRPISLLTTFSKIYEKLMHCRILKFLESNNSLYEMQYGFRPGRSCEHAILNAQNILLESLSKRQVSLLLLIDFSKAFDMVEHTILLKKLEHYGIRGMALKWMESYLNGRKQYVTVSGHNSTTRDMEHGVPQGSILGPLLFIIYINDIPETAIFAKFILYADDANIILTADTIDAISCQLAILIENLVKWVKSNGLALNLKKTKYMIFSQTKNIDLPSPLIIEKTAIERKSGTRFLGVIIDESLNWTKHINTVLSKMSRYVGIMYKIKKYLPVTARLQIYHSFVQSHLNYCSLVWGFTCKSNIEALFSKQKKGLRAVIPGFINYRYREGETAGHTKSAFSDYNVLTVQGIITLNTLLFIRKVRHFPSQLPLSIAATIAKDSPVHESTIDSCENWLKFYDNHLYRNSIFYKGPLLILSSKLENNLSPASYITIKAYKSNIKSAILTRQGDGDTIEWQAHNFPLYNIQGLRKSQNSYRIPVNYAEFYA